MPGRLKRHRFSILAGLVGVLIGAGAMLAANGYFVRSYLLANPDIIPEAMERLQNRDLAKAVEANRAAIETPVGSAWAGAKDGDVVLVEFFDYACGFCRASNADIDRLLNEDKRLKVVWRELPVLGPDSLAAAELSFAAARQGRFRDFYNRMFAEGRPTPETRMQVGQAVGVRPEPDSPEFRAEMQKNIELARAVRATGTPTFVVGNQVLQGAVGYEALKEAVEEARSSRS